MPSKSKQIILERESIQQLVGEFKILVTKLGMAAAIPKPKFEEYMEYIKQWEEAIY